MPEPSIRIVTAKSTESSLAVEVTGRGVPRRVAVGWGRKQKMQKYSRRLSRRSFTDPSRQERGREALRFVVPRCWVPPPEFDPPSSRPTPGDESLEASSGTHRGSHGDWIRDDAGSFARSDRRTHHAARITASAGAATDAHN
ncbi:unnamed protein product [Lampetra fluviatilis]